MRRAHRLTWVALEDHLAGKIGPHDPWGPLYVPLSRQGHSRFDNPRYYGGLYASRERACMYAEVFGGDFPRVTPGDLAHPHHDGVVRCVVTIGLSDPNGLCDLDDPHVLADRDIRPSSIVRRDRETTQSVALREWHARGHTGCIGLSWWSYYRPDWTCAMLWSDPVDDHGDAPVTSAKVTAIEPATIDDPDLLVAADACRFDVIG